jgi:hypothetical protein
VYPTKTALGQRCRLASFCASLCSPALAAEGNPAGSTPVALAAHAAGDAEKTPEQHGHFGDVLSLEVAYIEVLEQRPTTEEGGEGGSGHVLNRASAVGLAFEHSLVPGWLNARAGALFFMGLEGTELPTSLLLEIPWEVGRSTEVYLGAGLAADLIREDRFAPSFGLASAAGIYAWATRRLGANIDVEHRWVPSERRIYDLTVAIGAAARF